MFDKALAAMNRAFEGLIFLLFVLIVIVGGLQVFNRFVLNQSLSWSEEFMVYAHIWLIFLAIPVAYARGSHIGMNLFTKSLAPRVQAVLAFVIDVLWLVLASAIVFYTTVVMDVASNQTSPALGLRMDRAYLSLVVGGAYLAVLAFRSAVNSLGRLRSGGVTGGVPC
jgi:TRAP-type C4-dicarboxylate transport system permease small subunit